MADELMKRPTLRDGYVLQRMVELCMPRMKSYFASWDFDEKEIADDLKAVVTPYGDSYEMAKSMEHRGWNGSKALIELMEECSYFFILALDELTWQWVRCLNIKPKFAIGDRVAISLHGFNNGVVVRIDERKAEYGIQTSDQPENRWHVVKFEDVSELAGNFISTPTQLPSYAVAG